MLKCRIVSIALMLFMTTNQLFAQGDYTTRAKNYIEQYKDMAMAEQKRSGIPAAITLAQGIHETSAGNSELAINANNHFGIKCKKSWTGEKYSYTDDAPNECFRKYSSPIESYKDHSDYLASSPRYASLFTLSPTDYASWAIGLRQAGYATNPRYAQLLIKLIEEFRLQEYTYAALDNNILNKVAEAAPEEEIRPKHEEPWASNSGNIKVTELAPEPIPMQVDKPESFPPYGQLVKVNGLKAVYAKKGDMPLEYAINHNVRYERLLEINEIADRPLQSDMYLYLERKRFKGLKPTHTVQRGETLAKIAQYEGMQLRSLKELNQLSDGEEPAPGAVLYLQQEAPARPAVNIASAAVAEGTTGSVAQAVPPAAPESQFIETGNNQAPETQVQFAVNTEATPAVGQPKEIGPAPVPEVTKANDVQTSVEPGSILPPAPANEIARADVKPSEAASVNPPVNIANEKPVEEIIAEEKAKAHQEDEPKDELAALKAKFDKVVYAPKASPEVQPAAEPVVETPVVIEEPKAEKPAAGAKFYVVKKGDTAFGIAKRNNITVRELMDWNKLDFEGIKIGQKLRVKQ